MKLMGIVILSVFLFLSSLTYQADAAGVDFALHTGVSFVISTVSYNVYMDEFHMTENQAKVAAFLTTLAVGVIKESIDDDFSGSDMAGNTLGAGLGVIIGFEF